MMPPVVTEALSKKFNSLKVELNERSRRIWAATEALAIGHGGFKAVAKATGIAESTIRIGKKELQQSIPTKPTEGPPRRIRRKKGGRKPLTEFDNSLVSAIGRRGYAEKARNICTRITHLLYCYLTETFFRLHHLSLS